MEASHVAFLVNVLSHVEDFKVDWQKVAEENGITRKDNCITKFKGMMKKYGVDFTNNKLTLVEGHENVTSAPKTPKAKTPRKRKGDQEPDGETGGESPKKKTKAKNKVETTKSEDMGSDDQKEEEF